MFARAILIGAGVSLLAAGALAMPGYGSAFAQAADQRNEPRLVMAENRAISQALNDIADMRKLAQQPGDQLVIGRDFRAVESVRSQLPRRRLFRMRLAQLQAGPPRASIQAQLGNVRREMDNVERSIGQQALQLESMPETTSRNFRRISDGVRARHGGVVQAIKSIE